MTACKVARAPSAMKESKKIVVKKMGEFYLEKCRKCRSGGDISDVVLGASAVRGKAARG